MIDEDPEPALRARGEVDDERCEVVDAVHRFDHDPRLAQVVAPDVFEELGVVAALHPDPAGSRCLTWDGRVERVADRPPAVPVAIVSPQAS